jgi:AraC-like DNA-binding protein
VRKALLEPLLSNLIVTDTGHFPAARCHRIDRAAGAPELVIIYCTRGLGWVETAGQHRVVEPGCIAMFPPGIAHSYGADSQHPWSIYYVHLSGKLIGTVAAALTRANNPVLHVGDSPLIGETFEEIIASLEVGYGIDQLLLGAGVAHALVNRLVVAAGRATPGTSSTAQRMNACVAFLKTHLTQRIDVNRLAAMANYSPQHFAELFKRHTGFSPIDFFLRLRLQRAMELVITTQHPMKQISLETGFASQLYFSRQFKRIYGSAPTEVRAGGHHRSAV